MSEEAIVKLVMAILDKSFINNYKFYLLLGAIVFVSGSLSSFVISYMKQRGKSYATKADFDKIVEQLRKTTTLTENIRSDIAAEFLEKNSLRHLTREKIESIIDQTYKLELWLEQARSNAFQGKTPDNNDSPLAKIEMYQSIYFGKATEQMINLQKTYLPMMEFIFKLASQNLKGQPLKTEAFGDLQQALLISLNDFRKIILHQYALQNGL